jgi:hypothetical protein
MRPRFRLLSVLLVLALVAGACGSDEPPSPAEAREELAEMVSGALDGITWADEGGLSGTKVW